MNRWNPANRARRVERRAALAGLCWCLVGCTNQANLEALNGLGLDQFLVLKQVGPPFLLPLSVRDRTLYYRIHPTGPSRCLALCTLRAGRKFRASGLYHKTASMSLPTGGHLP